jgi:uncharacterized YigZ family protein
MSDPHYVESPSTAEVVEQKSRFLAFLYPCPSVDAFKSLQEALRRQHPQANHHAFAYRVREAGGALTARFSDDGEVAGTAGRPILAHLEGRDLVDVALFVVRYFGGIKLGSGGLARAYGASVKAVLAASAIKRLRAFEEWTCVASYASKGQFEHWARQHEVEILSCEFSEVVTFRARVFFERREAFLDSLRGVARVER